MKLVRVPLTEALTRNPYLVPFVRPVAVIEVPVVLPIDVYFPLR